MKSLAPVLLLLTWICLNEARQVRQTDQIIFDNELSNDINLNRIAEQPVKYRPFMYHQKYFTVNNYNFHIPSFTQLITVLPSFQEMTNTSFTYDRNSPISPRIWSRSFPSCGGVRQSPINLMTDDCLRTSALRSLWNMESDLEPENVIMENNGHSVEFSFEYPGHRPMLAGGPLRSMYVFEQLHFHWGTEENQGSEHYIDSQPGEMEMHVVHRNVKYGNMSTAAQNPDGIVVLGILFKTDPYAPDRAFLQNLGRVREMNTSATIRNSPAGFAMDDIVGSFSQPFIGYQGSLTTPPCHEAVSWLVAEEMKAISPRDVRSCYKRIRNLLMMTFSIFRWSDSGTLWSNKDDPWRPTFDPFRTGINESV